MAISLSEHFTYKKLIRFVLPCVIMMMVTSVYSIVDGFFVSNFVGKNSFAAVNLVMPVLMALGSFGFMIGTGGSALVAFTLGEGKKEKATQIFTMLVMVIVVVGIALSVIGFLFMEQIAILLGASELILEDCILYGRILLLANVFFMLQNSYQSFFVVAERPKMGLIISIATGITNIVLDFLLVYELRWGIAGAAIATAISQMLGGIIPTIFFIRKNSTPLRFVKTRLDWNSLWKACINGSSEMLTNLSASVVGILYNFQLMKIAAEDGVAAYGVIMYVSFIFMALYFGYAIGCGPLVGYHYGAGNRKELKSILKKSLMITLFIAIAMTLCGELLSTPLAKIFVGYDERLCEMTSRGMRFYAISFLFCGFNIFGSAFFTGLNNGIVSAIISFLRTLVFQIAAIFILPLLFQLDGVWMAIVVAEALTLIVTIILFLTNKKKYQY